MPSWVYEEEIFGGDSSLWFSPDSQLLAWCTFDETLVPEFTFPVYNPSNDNDKVVPYTQNVKMRYPKPGYPNPLVKVLLFDLAEYRTRGSTTDETIQEHVYELSWDGRHAGDNSIISEVAWVGNHTLIVKEVNRNADNGSVVLFDLSDTVRALAPVHPKGVKGKVVRRLGRQGEEGDEGWIDQGQTIRPLPEALLRKYAELGHTTEEGSVGAYLDVVPTKEGYNHIALFSPADSQTPRFLTGGEWEISGKVEGVDAQGNV